MLQEAGPGCPALLPGSSLPRPPGRLDPSLVLTLQMGVGDLLSERDHRRGESVQGSGSERGGGAGWGVSRGRDAECSGRAEEE